jgi:ribulose-bisphosphate carboxylase large chain
MTPVTPEEPISLRYRIQAIGDARRAAELIAGEMSSGTFVNVPGETAELTRAHRARVSAVQILDRPDAAALDSRRVIPGSRLETAEISIEMPAGNVGENLPTLVAAIAGNITELGEITGLRLVDVTIPDTYRQRFPGPKFGVKGTRKLTGVDGRPLFGTIIKPSVGLSPAQTADLVRQLGMAGLDFIKDDELMADPPHSPFRDRVTQVMPSTRSPRRPAARSCTPSTSARTPTPCSPITITWCGPVAIASW